MNICHMTLFLLHQFFTPISSFPVSMLWAWCLVAWGRTRRCILSLALPWYIQRRPNQNRGASLSSTTLMVRSLFCLVFVFSFFSWAFLPSLIPAIFPPLIILNQLSSDFAHHHPRSFIYPVKGALLAFQLSSYILFFSFVWIIYLRYY